MRFFAVAVLVGTAAGGFCGTNRFPLVVNEDNDHFFKLSSDWMNREGLVRYLDDVLQGPVTHFAMCVNGQRTSYDSKTWEPIWMGIDEKARPDTATRGRTRDRWAVNAKILFDAGIDPYEVWIRRCREKGVSPWVSMRMNDSHYMTVSNYFRNTTFCRTHREYWRKPTAAKYWDDCCLDFAHAEVRAYTFRQVAEIAERWDADGVELDWMRSPYHFRKGREREDAHCLTEFMRRVRACVREISKRKGREIRLSVRLPRSPGAAERAGFEAGVWLREGLVDVVVGSSVFRADVELPVAEWIAFVKENNPKVVFLPSIDCFSLPDIAHFRGMADRYCQGGATGLYLFNAPYCGKYDTDGRKHAEDTFGIVCREGLDPASLKGRELRVPKPFVDFRF